MELIGIIVIVVTIWYFAGRRKVVQQEVAPVSPKKLDGEDEVVNYTEEQVLSYQTSFEEKIHDEIDFPDAIQGEDLYVYKELMKPWFQKLSAKNRYDEKMVQRIRNDFFEYMYLMRDFATVGYLSGEFEGEKGDEYTKRARQSAKKIIAIEEAFAAYVGEDAENELKKIRDMDFSLKWQAFNKFGEMAPEGKEYNLSGDLVNKKR